MNLQRENRILAKQIHNLRKEGHIKIANLKQKYQNEQATDNKLRSKLNHHCEELQKKKLCNSKLVK